VRPARGLGLDLVVASRLLGFVGTIGAITAVIWVYRADTFRAALPGFTGALALAVCGPIVVWTVGGLEQPLLAGLLAWALAFSFLLIDEPRPKVAAILRPGLFFGLICLTRADGALFTMAAFLGLLIARGVNRESLRIGALLIRSPWPSSAGSSRSGSPITTVDAELGLREGGLSHHRVRLGVEYVLVGGIYLAGVVVPAMLAFFVATRRRCGSSALPRIRAVRLAGAVILVGGDQFSARRHFVPPSS
jgi:hypothetical protein